MIRQLLVAALLTAAVPAFAASPLLDTGRPAEDKARDADRKPAELIAFAGIKPGMVVGELYPGGGYFTRIFSNAVGPKGKVIAYLPDEQLVKNPKGLDRVTAIAAEPEHTNVMPMHNPLMAPSAADAIDVVWTSENYHDIHNLPGVDMVAFNKLVYRELKPGGVYIITDHAAAAGSGAANTSDLHRIDPAQVRKEVEAAGFTFAGENKVLANPADTHALKIFDPAIRGHTDQFALKFRKGK
jgi:predicted methyltransferase